MILTSSLSNCVFVTFSLQVVLNYFATSFMVLDLKESLQVYASLYYAPVIIVVTGTLLGPLLTGMGAKKYAKGADKK